MTRNVSRYFTLSICCKLAGGDKNISGPTASGSDSDSKILATLHGHTLTVKRIHRSKLNSIYSCDHCATLSKQHTLLVVSSLWKTNITLMLPLITRTFDRLNVS